MTPMKTSVKSTFTCNNILVTLYQIIDTKRNEKYMKTRKKTKIIGHQKLFKENGEIIECQVVSIEERDSNFHKIWLGHIIQSLDLVGNQKVRLINFILQNLDSENKLVMTQRKIAEKSKISFGTVITTIRILHESNFLTKINSGAYQVNPDLIFKGGTGTRMNVLFQYNQAKIEVAATRAKSQIALSVPSPVGAENGKSNRE